MIFNCNDIVLFFRQLKLHLVILWPSIASIDKKFVIKRAVSNSIFYKISSIFIESREIFLFFFFWSHVSMLFKNTLSWPQSHQTVKVSSDFTIASLTDTSIRNAISKLDVCSWFSLTFSSYVYSNVFTNINCLTKHERV